LIDEAIFPKSTNRHPKMMLFAILLIASSWFFPKPFDTSKLELVIPPCTDLVEVRVAKQVNTQFLPFPVLQFIPRISSAPTILSNRPTDTDIQGIQSLLSIDNQHLRRS
jgi:hypothetical protein